MRPSAAGAAGTTFVELLVALAVLGGGLAMTAVAASFVLGAFEAEPAAADEQQRARAGLQVLVDDLARAGSGFYLDADEAPGVALPALVPDTLAPGAWAAAAQPHTLSTWRARRDTPQARLAAAAMAGPLVVIRWLSRPGIAIDPLIGTEDPLLFPTRTRERIARSHLAGAEPCLADDAPAAAALPEFSLDRTRRCGLRAFRSVPVPGPLLGRDRRMRIAVLSFPLFVLTGLASSRLSPRRP